MWNNKFIEMLKVAATTETLDTYAFLHNKGFKGSRQDVINKLKELGIIDRYTEHKNTIKDIVIIDKHYDSNDRKINKVKHELDIVNKNIENLANVDNIINDLVSKEKAHLEQLDSVCYELMIAEEKYDNIQKSTIDKIINSSLNRSSKVTALKMIGVKQKDIKNIMGVSAARVHQLDKKNENYKDKVISKNKIKLKEASLKFKNWSLYKLAIELNIPNYMVYQWNNGSIQPKIDSLQKICNVLGCTLNDLYE